MGGFSIARDRNFGRGLIDALSEHSMGTAFDRDADSADQIAPHFGSVKTAPQVLGGEAFRGISTERQGAIGASLGHISNAIGDESFFDRVIESQEHESVPRKMNLIFPVVEVEDVAGEHRGASSQDFLTDLTPGVGIVVFSLFPIVNLKMLAEILFQ